MEIDMLSSVGVCMLRVRLAMSALLFCLGASTVTLADHKDRYHAGALDARQHGYEHGYRDGFHEGVKDRDHRNKFKPDAKDADAGYENYMGSKGDYKDGYRSGFNSGYEDGFYNRPPRFSEVYGPYDEVYRSRGSADRYDDIYVQRRWGAADVAYDIGYRDGLSAGTDDFSRRHNARPEDQHDYKEADHGYRSDYGDKALYRQQYRNGFLQGYQDAYRGVRP
jgi:hypothetical protein